MLVLFLFLTAMYWLPTIIAVVRKSPSAMAVAALNFFLGWTVIGWVIALVWSLAAIPPTPQVIVHVDGGRATISTEPKV